MILESPVYPLVPQGLYDWWAVPMREKDELKYVIMDAGVQYVTGTGTFMMHM